MIGAQMSKNPGPLLDSLDYLPPNCMIRFFGFDRGGFFAQASRRFGSRVDYVGPLFDADLARYYQSLDVMVSTEEHAGWANVVAEAMASGVAVVTTPAGTQDMAKHLETALIIPTATPENLSSAIFRLHQNRSLADSLVSSARRQVEKFDWQTYSAKLLTLIRGFDGQSHYLHAPEVGLFGKAPLSERIEGLQLLLDQAQELETILDVGCAEGALANAFLERGAGRVDAYELDKDRVEAAVRIFGKQAGLRVRRADLALESDLQAVVDSAPQSGYSFTLYLGVHHHLPASSRLSVLNRLLTITSGRVAIRVLSDVEAADNLPVFLGARGFSREYMAAPGEGSFAGPLYVYRRTEL